LASEFTTENKENKEQKERDKSGRGFARIDADKGKVLV
jgi:hypothetical protein